MNQNIVAYMKKKLPEQYHSTLIPDYREFLTRNLRFLLNILLRLSALHCKRVAYDAGWLESFHLPNVHLLATPIVSVEEAGLRTSDGKLHEFDIIMWAVSDQLASSESI